MAIVSAKSLVIGHGITLLPRPSAPAPTHLTHSLNSLFLGSLRHTLSFFLPRSTLSHLSRHGAKQMVAQAASSRNCSAYGCLPVRTLRRVMTGVHFMTDGTAPGGSWNTYSWLGYGSYPSSSASCIADNHTHIVMTHVVYPVG
jgi:hypothetical protein